MHTKLLCCRYWLLAALTYFSLISALKADLEIKDLDQYLNAWVKNRHFSGAVLVAKGDEILLRKGYGNLNDESGQKVEVKTVFRIASITKSFTALAIMQLEEEKKLSLNDTLDQFITDYPNGANITLFQILHHTSGIPDIVSLPEYGQKLAVHCSILESIDVFKNAPLAFKPGSQWGYSSSNYILLSHIIEKVSGLTLEQYLKKKIFDPLCMKQSGLESDTPIEEFGATGYRLGRNSRVAMPLVNMSVNAGAGAMYSTIDDLFKWERSFNSNKLVEKSTLKKIFTPHKNAYGGGWGISTHARLQKKCHFMNGRFSGFTANITRIPADDLCVIVLSNLQDIDPRIIADNLLAICAGQYAIPPSTRTQAQIDQDQLQLYEGTYHFAQLNLKIAISVDPDGKVWRTIEGRPKKQMFPFSSSGFFYQDNDVDIYFRKDQSGQFNVMYMNLLGRPAKGSRVIPIQQEATDSKTDSIDINAAHVKLLAHDVNILDGVYVDGDDIYTTCGGLFNRKTLGKFNPKSGFKIVSREFAGTIDVTGDENFVYATNYDDNTVKKIEKKTGKVTTIAKGLDGPAGIERMPDGNLYVTNFGAPPTYSGDSIYKVDPNGGKALVLKDRRLKRPQGLARWDDETLIVSNSPTGEIFRFNIKTKHLKPFAKPQIQIGNLTVAKKTIFAASNKDNQILKIDANGNVEKKLFTNLKIENPLGIDFDQKNNRLIIAEARKGNLKAIYLSKDTQPNKK